MYIRIEVRNTSRRYQSTLAAHGAILSMSRLGDPYDNAVMESFYKTLKRELMPETRKFTNEKEESINYFV